MHNFSNLPWIYNILFLSFLLKELLWQKLFH